MDISAKTDEGIYRISLKGKEAIREYCKTNILQESLLGNNLEVIIKKPVIGVYPILLNDINFKIDLKQETPVPRFKVSEFNGVELTMTLLIPVIALFLIWYSKKCISKGWLK